MARHWTEVKGWLGSEEGELLRALAVGRRVLEIGSYHGRSTIAMAEVAASVVSVDHHKGDEGVGPADTEASFRANLETFEVAHKVDVRVADVADVAFHLFEPFDMAFVDGSHVYEHVFRDLAAAIDAVRPGGIVAWHDANYFSVASAVEAHDLKTMGRIGNLAWTVIGA